jgi:hypothetical protein
MKKGNLNESSQMDSNTFTSSSSVGFSKFGHFKAPIKRPSCNPIVKDERFRRYNLQSDGN